MRNHLDLCPNCLKPAAELVCTDCIQKMVLWNSNDIREILPENERFREIAGKMCLVQSNVVERNSDLRQKEKRIEKLKLYCQEMEGRIAHEMNAVRDMETCLGTYRSRISHARRCLEISKNSTLNFKSLNWELEEKLKHKMKSIRKLQLKKLEKLYSFFNVEMNDHTIGSIVGILLSTNIETFISSTILDDLDCVRISALFGYIAQLTEKISKVLCIPLQSVRICCQGSTSSIEHFASGKTYNLFLLSDSPSHVDAFMNSIKVLGQILVGLLSSVNERKARNANEFAFIPNLLMIRDEYRLFE